MKIQHSNGSGYTIVEVMIFLAVSSLLLVSAMLVLSGRQRKTEFNQGIREADSKIQDVVNDFAAGYFPDSDFDCSADNIGNSPVISAGSGTQGTRGGCTYIGKVIQFAPENTDENGYKVITVAGRQFYREPLSRLVENIVEAKPKAVLLPSIPEDSGTFGYGLKVKWVRAEGSPSDIGAIGFFSSFAQNDSSGLVSGKQTTQLVALGGTSLNASTSLIESNINAIGTGGTIYINVPVSICIESGDSSQHGIINIGSDQRELATRLQIGNGVCPA